MATPTTYRYAFIIDDDLHIVDEFNVSDWSQETYEQSKAYWDGVREAGDGGTWIYVELEATDEA